MADGVDPGDAKGEDRKPGVPDRAAPSPAPQAPKTRPAWLLLLSFVMVMSAAHLGMEGLDVLSNRPEPPPPHEGVVMNISDVLWRMQAMVAVVARREHPAVVLFHAAGQLAVAAFLLYAVATVFTRDPRGRRFAIAAGWVGIAHELSDALFALTVSRHAFLSVRPRFLDEVARLVGKTSPDPDVAHFLTALEQSTLLAPWLGAAFGILLSGLIVIFFQGRRGRILYGLEAATGARA